MTPRAYYNEIDKFTAAWLRELIKADLIAPGDVDDRSITDVRPADLDGYTQCHFFAGIGGWSLALRLAGWPDDRAVWSGSCPCQPFSSAGKGDGFADERHLWPSWFWLIGQRRPRVVVGEQVESPAARAWLDLVFTDLEAVDYAGGSVDLPAASIGAPHIRQRLVWVADCENPNRWSEQSASGTRSGWPGHPGSGAALGLADSNNGASIRRNSGGEVCESRLHDRLDASGHSGVDGMAIGEHAERRPVSLDREDGRDRPNSGRQEAHGQSRALGEVQRLADESRGGLGIDGPASRISGHADERGSVERMGDAGLPPGCAEHEHEQGNESRRRAASTDAAGSGPSVESVRLVDRLIARLEGHGRDGNGGVESRRLDQDAARSVAATGATRGAWGGADWLYCTDEKFRPVEPGTFPLAHGLPGRVGRLRGYGNAIVPEKAAEVIRAYMEVRGVV